jgi:hypothetical protein
VAPVGTNQASQVNHPALAHLAPSYCEGLCTDEIEFATQSFDLRTLPVDVPQVVHTAVPTNHSTLLHKTVKHESLDNKTLAT